MRVLISLTLLLVIVGVGYLMLVEDEPVLPVDPPPVAQPEIRRVDDGEVERPGARIPPVVDPAAGSLAPASRVLANARVAEEAGLVAIHCEADGMEDQRVWSPEQAQGARIEGGWLYATVPATQGVFALGDLEVHWRANHLGEAVPCWTHPLRPQLAPEGAVPEEEAEVRPRGPGGEVLRAVGQEWKELSTERVAADLQTRRDAIERALARPGLTPEVRKVLLGERAALAKGP